MEAVSKPTRFAELERGQAAAILVTTLTGIVWTVAVALSQHTLPPTEPPRHIGPDGERLSDEDFYERIVARVHAGENYYDALPDELARPEWGMKPRSVFNWRLPTYAWLIGLFPVPEWGQVLVALLAMATSVLAIAVVNREFGMQFIPLTILLIGPFAWCITGKVYLFTELWAGTLIALSALAYSMDGAGQRGVNPRALAVSAGLLALFFRELALPYCLLALVLATWERQWKEVAAWTAGLAVFALFYSYHYVEASKRMVTGEALQTSHWICFGGTAFIIGTVELNNILLILLPAWISAIYLPLALLGLAGWRSAAGLRACLTSVGYLLAFAIFGQPSNAYWGLLIAPLLALGIITLPAAMRDLLAAVASRQSALGSSSRQWQ